MLLLNIRKYKFALATTLTLSCAVAFTACARPKKPVPKTNMEEPNKAAGETGTGTGKGAGAEQPKIDLDTLSVAAKAFADKDGLLNKEALKKMLTKSGLGDPAILSYVIDAKEDKEEKDERITDKELLVRVPTLEWALKGPLTAAELDAHLLKLLPNSTKTSRDALLETAKLLDTKGFGGNEDQKYSQSELLPVGALVGFAIRKNIDQQDRPWLEARFGARAITDFGYQNAYRYSSAAAPDDQKIEWTNYLLKKYLVTNQLSGAKGNLAASSFKLLTPWGVEVPETETAKWTKFRGLYDQKTLFNGNLNKKLDADEAFHMISDLQFAKKTLAKFEKGLSAEEAEKQPELIKTIAAFFPKVGNAILLNADGKANAEFWNGITAEQHPLVLELSLSLSNVTLCEQVLRDFDANKDDKLQLDEAKAAASALGVSDASVIEHLFGGKDQLSPIALYKSFNQALAIVESGSAEALESLSKIKAAAEAATQAAEAAAAAAQAAPAQASSTPADAQTPAPAVSSTPATTDAAKEEAKPATEAPAVKEEAKPLTAAEKRKAAAAAKKAKEKQAERAKKRKEAREAAKLEKAAKAAVATPAATESAPKK